MADLAVHTLAFPPALHYDIEHQTWARLDADGLVTIGITALGIGLSGEIYMCRPKDVGQVVERGRSVAVVELAKAIVAVKAPLSGTVLAVNPLLAAQPELVHLQPYDDGWLVRLRPQDWHGAAAGLVTGDAVQAAMAIHLQRHRDEQADGAAGDGVM
ncbi:MAG: glycine cleavage system protein H [Aquabacterium sp.]